MDYPAKKKKRGRPQIHPRKDYPHKTISDCCQFTVYIDGHHWDKRDGKRYPFYFCNKCGKRCQIIKIPIKQ